jgi:hypothetical protein
VRTDAVVLHLTRYKRSGWEVAWSRYATYVGPVPSGEFESAVHRCAVYLIITAMFAAEWRNYAYMDLFYSRVLEKDYAAALAIPRPLDNASIGWVAESAGEGTSFLLADAKRLQIEFSPSQTRLEEVW